MEFKLYSLKDVVSFHKTDEEYGILSNMKGRLCLHIDNTIIFHLNLYIKRCGLQITQKYKTVFYRKKPVNS
jgi:hypothetical protein